MATQRLRSVDCITHPARLSGNGRYTPTSGCEATSSGVPVSNTVPPLRPAFGAHVDKVIGSLYDVEVVLDNQYRISLVDQTIEYTQQHPYVFKMQTGGRLVKDIQCFPGIFFSTTRWPVSPRWLSPPERVVEGWPSFT